MNKKINMDFSEDELRTINTAFVFILEKWKVVYKEELPKSLGNKINKLYDRTSDEHNFRHDIKI